MLTRDDYGLSPMTNVSWIAITDSVRDAFDHMETDGLDGPGQRLRSAA